VEKLTFDIDTVVERVRIAVQAFPKAALFELAEDGFNSPFEVLVACIISIRTLDEVTLTVARRLFACARTPEAISQISVAELDRLIGPTAFHESKAPQIAAIARRVITEFGGVVPCDDAVLRSFGGVGPKCASLVLSIACGLPRVSVDVHVHRVTNRWGYVATKTPEQTMTALEEKLPKRYWVEINKLLIPFGKHICTGRLPFCSTCPVLLFCRQVGVTAHR
jgi:endonuclease-3